MKFDVGSYISHATKKFKMIAMKNKMLLTYLRNFLVTFWSQ